MNHPAHSVVTIHVLPELSQLIHGRLFTSKQLPEAVVLSFEIREYMKD